MTQKRRDLLAKKVVDDDGIDSDSDNDVNNAGDEKTTAFNVDVLLSEEKNPWIGQTVSENENETEMKERMTKLLKDMEKVPAASRVEVNPTDFGFVKEKNLLKVGENNVSDDDDDGNDESEDEEMRQQVKQFSEFKDTLTKGCNLALWLAYLLPDPTTTGSTPSIHPKKIQKKKLFLLLSLINGAG